SRLLPKTMITAVASDDAALLATSRDVAANGRIRLVPADAATGLPFAPGTHTVVLTRRLLDESAPETRDAILEEVVRQAPQAAVHCESREQLEAAHSAYWRQLGPVHMTVRHLKPHDGQAAHLMVHQLSEPLLSVLALRAVEEPPEACRGTPAERCFMPPNRLCAIVSEMMAAGFQFVSLSQAASLMRRDIPLPRRTAVITFDHGYRSVHTHALPVLAELGVSAAVFPITTAINRCLDVRESRGAGVERPALTVRHLRELHAAGWDIGSHSVTRAGFAHLTPQQVQSELADGRRQLEDLIGVAARFLAVPCDSAAPFCGQHVEQARAEGYELVVTTTEGFAARAGRSIVWPRIAVDGRFGPRALFDHMRQVHRTQAGWRERPPASIEDLPHRIRRIVNHCLTRNWSRIAVCDHDSQTHRLLTDGALRPLRLEAIFSDQPIRAQDGDVQLPVRRLSELMQADVDAIIVRDADASRRLVAAGVSGDGPAILQIYDD
ncbi:MAG: polysaccharide deacetylase family protein, partial [Phycisphaerae bacterium]